MSPGPSSAAAARNRQRSLTVIFKGSNRCNAGCTFCAVGEAGARVMGWEELEVMATQLERLVEHWGVDRLEFTFHGGEPTLLGPEFIDRACARVRGIAAHVGFLMQSNLLDWDDTILEVVRRHAITIGTSIDPIAGDRLDGRGRDAFPAWRESYVRLAKEIRAPGAIFVVTRKALGQTARLFEIAQALAKASGQRFGLQLNPVYPQGKAAQNDDVLISPEEFGRFLIDMWREWRRSPNNVRLTPIQDFSDHFFPTPGRSPVLACSFKGQCSRHHVGIDFDLNVARCGRRLDSKAFLGSLKQRSLVEILEESAEARLIAERSAHLERQACSECSFFEICAGGCPDDAALGPGGIADRTPWCAGYRLLFEAMAAESERPRGTPKARKAGTPETVRLALDPNDVPPPEPDRASELWLLPTRDARALRFENGLSSRLAAWPGPKRLFVYNERARSLALWEQALQRPGVSVVLFEDANLEAALEVVNGLHASVRLDLVEISQSEAGAAAVMRVLERFLFDHSWAAQVMPFSQILLNAIHGRRQPHTNRWGLTPGAFTVEGSVTPTDRDGPLAAALDASLREEATVAPAQWLARRPACSPCPHLSICGGQLARGDGRACTSGARAIVARLAEAGEAMRPELRAYPLPH